MIRTLLIGEAWGEKEEMFEHAFVGPSGREAARIFADAGLTQPLRWSHPSELEMVQHWQAALFSGVALENVFAARPPDNLIGHFFTTKEEGIAALPPIKIKIGTTTRAMYLKPEMMPQLERLWQRIDDLKPNLLVALGNTASWAVLGEGNITAIRGTIKLSERCKIKVLPTFHPAAVLRQWSLRPIVVKDLQKAKEESAFPEIRRIERWLINDPSLAEIEEWATRPAERYSVDIETKFNTISMIGFARTPADAITIPFLDELRADWNYWRTIEDEMQAWRLVQRLLERPVPKLFQNGIFDLTYLLRAGLRPTMCHEDSMLLHHSLYPELPKALGFLGSIYSGEISWKQMRRAAQSLKRDE